MGLGHTGMGLGHTRMGLRQTPVTQNLGTYGVRIFVRGDHMLPYKVLGADGPTSTHVDRQPSPYCTTPGDAVRDYSRPTCPLATTHKCNALVKGVPVAQHPPDILHGVCNVLFTIVILLIENLFMDDLQWTATTTQQFLGNLGMENLSGDDLEKEARLTRPIDHALDFMRKRNWKTIVEAMYLSKKQLMHNGTMRNIHTLINALIIHLLTVLDAAHKPQPLSDQDVALVEAVSGRWGELASTQQHQDKAKHRYNIDCEIKSDVGVHCPAQINTLSSLSVPVLAFRFILSSDPYYVIVPSLAVHSLPLYIASILLTVRVTHARSCAVHPVMPSLGSQVQKFFLNILKPNPPLPSSFHCSSCRIVTNLSSLRRSNRRLSGALHQLCGKPHCPIRVIRDLKL